MITLSKLTLAYGSRVLLDGADASVPRASLTALIGRNGAGKSTLLRAIAGLNRHYSGSIAIDGTDTRHMSAAGMARALAFVSTERTRIANLTCRALVSLGRAPYTNWAGSLSPADNAIVDSALADTGMSEYAARTMDTMSDGECQRVMIARALAQQTPAILLDEPTSFLDMPNRYLLALLLRRLARDSGRCVLFSTHELDVAMRVCDSIMVIDGGRLWHMTPQELAASGLLGRLFSAEGVEFGPDGVSIDCG